MDRAVRPALGAGLWYRTDLARLRDALRLRAGVPHEEHREPVPVRVGGAEPSDPRYAKEEERDRPRAADGEKGAAPGFGEAAESRESGGVGGAARGEGVLISFFFVVA